MRNTVVALMSAALMVGCGGSTIEPAGSGGAAGASGAGGGTGGAAASGGAAGYGGHGATGGSGAMGGSAGTGGMSCHDFEDESAPPQGVTIRLVNKRPTPIYLGDPQANCGPVPPYTLNGPTGPVRMFAGGCGNTCEALQQHPDYCAGACMIPPVVVINPGGYYDAGWAGMTFVSTNMPTACYYDKQYAPPTCDRRLVAPAGSYDALARAWTELVCLDVGICSCEPGPTGSCEIPYYANPSGTQIETQAAFEMPSASLVTLTFE
jgi:hypothetical protein